MRSGDDRSHGTTTIREAIALVPDDVSVTATYTMGPHLSHREQIYDWPNPWVPVVLGQRRHLQAARSRARSSTSCIDRQQVGPEQQDLLAELISPDGEYEVLLDADDVVVGRRIDS